MDSTPLGTYLDKPVFKTATKITNTGDGLSKALGIDPQVLDPDKPVFVVLRCVPTNHILKPMVLEDTQQQGWELIYQLKAGLATIVDGELVKEVLDEQQKKIDDAAGIQRLPNFDADGNITDEREKSQIEREVANIAGRKKKAKADADLDQVGDV